MSTKKNQRLAFIDKADIVLFVVEIPSAIPHHHLCDSLTMYRLFTPKISELAMTLNPNFP